jgi:hypothetical protein
MASSTKQENSGKSFKDASKKKTSALGNWFGFFSSSKKWWLMPMVAVLLVLGLLFVLSSTVAAPFIYTLF